MKSIVLIKMEVRQEIRKCLKHLFLQYGKRLEERTWRTKTPSQHVINATSHSYSKLNKNIIFFNTWAALREAKSIPESVLDNTWNQVAKMFRNAYLTMVWEALVGSDNTYLKCSNGHLEQKGTSYKKAQNDYFYCTRGALTGPDHTWLRISNGHLERKDTSCKNHQNTYVLQ